MALVWVRYRTVFYWLCIIFFTRVQQISFGFHATAYAMLIFDARLCLFKKTTFLTKLASYILHYMYNTLFKPAYSVFSCKFPATCFFLISNQHFVVLFAMISSYCETCCTRFLPQLKLLIFEESYLRPINNLSTYNSHHGGMIEKEIQLFFLSEISIYLS